MKQILFSILILSMFFASCTADEKTTRLSFNGGELLYTDSVTEAQAKDLGDYLVKTNFYDGRKKTVQLDKEANVFHFAMIPNDSIINSPQYTALAQTLCDNLSEYVFNGAKVEVDFCDDLMHVKKNIKAIPDNSSTENTGKITGNWICVNLTGGETTDTKKQDAELEVLRTNFTFTFNADQTFKSNFINLDAVNKPLTIQGYYTIVKNKISFHHLTINNKPAEEEMLFSIVLYNGEFQLISQSPGSKDLVITFEKT